MYCPKLQLPLLLFYGNSPQLFLSFSLLPSFGLFFREPSESYCSKSKIMWHKIMAVKPNDGFLEHETNILTNHTETPHDAIALWPYLLNCSLFTTYTSLLVIPQPFQSDSQPEVLIPVLPPVWNILFLNVHLNFSFTSFRSLLSCHIWGKLDPNHCIPTCTYMNSVLLLLLCFSSEHSSPSIIDVYFFLPYLLCSYLVKSELFEDEDLFCSVFSCNANS